MSVLFLIFFAVVDYYVVLVFFKEKNRRNAFVSLLWLISYIALSKLATSIFLSTDSHYYNLAGNSLISFAIILTVAFFCQLVAMLIDRVINWHREHNKANLHRQPIRFAIKWQAQITAFATYFYFLASLLILWGIWLGPIEHTS